MNDFKGRYCLIAEDVFENTREYFDFSCDTMDFVQYEDASVPSVSIASIDSLTTLFESFYELDSYLSKNQYQYVSPEDRTPVKAYVSYKSNTTKEEAFLDAVWNDNALYEIAKHAKGSRVDFNNSTTMDTFSTIYNELTDCNSSFATELLSSNSNTFSLNNHNKKLVSLAHSGFYNGDNFFCKVLDSFSSYREFRALYLAYKKHKLYLENSKSSQLLKK